MVAHALTEEINRAVALRQRESYAKHKSAPGQKELQWITIGGTPDGDKKHAGGTPVQITKTGQITKGPKDLTGHKVGELGAKTRKANEAKASAETAAKKKPAKVESIGGSSSELEPWQKTREEYEGENRGRGLPKGNYDAEIETAIEEGKPVPRHIVKEFASVAKEHAPHLLTQAEYQKQRYGDDDGKGGHFHELHVAHREKLAKEHRKYVEDAISNGKHVPDDVLAEHKVDELGSKTRRENEAKANAGSSGQPADESRAELKKKPASPKGPQSFDALNVTATKEGRRVWLSGKTFDHKDTIRAAGGKWDSDSQRWWIGSAKWSDLESKLQAKNDKLAKFAPAEQKATPATDSPNEPKPAPASKITIGGNTFAHKDKIRAAGGKWDGARKVWTVDSKAAEKLRNLSGLKFSDDAAKQQAAKAETMAAGQAEFEAAEKSHPHRSSMSANDTDAAFAKALIEKHGGKNFPDRHQSRFETAEQRDAFESEARATVAKMQADETTKAQEKHVATVQKHGRTPRGNGRASSFTAHAGHGRRAQVEANYEQRQPGDIIHRKDGPWMVTESSRPHFVSDDHIEDMDAWSNFKQGAGWYAEYKAVPVEPNDVDVATAKAAEKAKVRATAIEDIKRTARQMQALAADDDRHYESANYKQAMANLKRLEAGEDAVEIIGGAEKYALRREFDRAFAVEREQYAKRKSAPGQKTLKWITLKNDDGGGGTHVQIDGKGQIQKGPAALTGHKVGELGAAKRRENEARANEPETKAQTPAPVNNDNPFRAKHEAAQRKADQLAGGTAQEKAMAESFPLGGGFGRGSERSRSKSVDASVDRATQAVEASKQAKMLKAQADAFDRGEINASGRAVNPNAKPKQPAAPQGRNHGRQIKQGLILNGTHTLEDGTKMSWATNEANAAKPTALVKFESPDGSRYQVDTGAFPGSGAAQDGAVKAAKQYLGGKLAPVSGSESKGNSPELKSESLSDRIEAADPIKRGTQIVDFGPRQRGQGRRIGGGMIVGSGTGHPGMVGKQEYPDSFANVPDYKDLPREQKVLLNNMDPIHVDEYLKARGAGLPHMAAAAWAISDVDDPNREAITQKWIDEAAKQEKRSEVASAAQASEPKQSGTYQVGEKMWFKGDEVTISGEPYNLYGGTWQDGKTADGKTVTVKSSIGDKPKPSAPAPFKPAPVPGQQMGLFGQKNSGQGQLFNVAKPGKRDAKAAAQASMLEQIEDSIKKREAEAAPLKGQREMFSRSLTDEINRAVGVERYELRPAPKPAKRTQRRQPDKVTVPKKRQPGDGSAGWQRVGGAPVFVNGDGKITKGCPGLKGEHVSDLIDEPDDSRERREVRQAHAKAEGIDGKQYSASDRRRHETKKARAAHTNAKAAAKQHGVATHEVLKEMPAQHEATSFEDREAEEARKRARQMTGLTAGRQAAVENRYEDYSTFPGFDESSRDFASEYPHLFDPDADDTPAQVWDFIREGKQSAESASSESVAGRAAERLASLRNSVATELDDALSFGFGANVPEDDSF
jgi:hypothetical protein